MELVGTSSYSYNQPSIPVGQGLGMEDEARLEDEGESVSGFPTLG